MTSDVYCPCCGHKLLVDWEFEEVVMISSDSAADGTEHVLYGDERAPEIVWRISHKIVWRISYKRYTRCPVCGTKLEISHTLVPHFTAEFAR